MTEKIIRNSARCKVCGTHIISVHRHDFKECKCGKIFVDGGKDYLRRGGDLDAIEETSLVIEKQDPIPPAITQLVAVIYRDGKRYERDMEPSYEANQGFGKRGIFPFPVDGELRTDIGEEEYIQWADRVVTDF